jgi:hypothetical protein
VWKAYVGMKQRMSPKSWCWPGFCQLLQIVFVRLKYGKLIVFWNLSLQNTLLQSFKAIVQRILSGTKAHARRTHCDGEAKARFTISFFLVLSSVLWSTPLPRRLLSSTLDGFIRPSICTRCTFGTHFQRLDPHVLVTAFRRNVAQA